MERQTCAKDGADNDIIDGNGRGGRSQRRLHLYRLIAQGLAYLVSHHMTYALHIATKTHAVSLHLHIAQLRDILVEHRVAGSEIIDYHSYSSFGNIALSITPTMAAMAIPERRTGPKSMPPSRP